jgi:hypothetical protein
MRRFIAVGAIAILVGLVALPLTSAGSTPVTRHVDGTAKVFEPARGDHGERQWLARFEVRTTAGAVDFGYMHLYGIDGDVAGQIHEFSVYKVDYYKTASGAQGATLWTEECFIVPSAPCQDDGADYQVSDKGAQDTFLANANWTVVSGNISIYSTGGQNIQ